VIPDSFEECVFNWAAQSMATVGTERHSGLLFVTHEISPTLTLSAQAGYDHYDVDRVLASQPVSGFAAALPTYTGNPLVPAEHPDNPFGQDVEITYRLTEFAPRDISTETTGRRALLELEWLRGTWRWRGYGAWSDSRSDTDAKNRVRMDRFQEALLGWGGPNGDQTFNPFGINPDNDPALIDWVRVSTHNKLDTRERAFGLAADGVVFQLPSGSLGLAFGAEYREQNVWQTADPLDLEGVTAELEWLPVSENRDVRAAFAELSIPVLDSVEIQLAGRLEDYSDFGSEFSPKLALAWRPMDTLLVRGSYSESFLPPNFRELYDPRTQQTQELVDSVRCPITNEPRDCEGDFYPVVSGGNPDLDPETAESWYAGLLWSPRTLEGLDLELSYWSFEFNDRIGSAWAQFVVDSAGANSHLVSRLEPTPEDEALGAPGRIEQVNNTFLNLSVEETSGVDFALRYTLAPNRLGDFTLGVNGTYVDEMKIKLPSAFDFWEYNGENLAGTATYWGTGQPEWRMVSSLDWRLGNTGASAVMTWFDSYEDYRNYPSEDNRSQSDRKHTVDSWKSWDFQVSQTFPSLRDGRFSVGCVNCFDEEPPLYFAYRGGPNGVDYGLHDIRGRSWYARWSQPFGGGRRD
jgi:outer membrane receptor protein involved in Fe transport